MRVLTSPFQDEAAVQAASKQVVTGLRAVDYFAGAGGSSQGLHAAGLDVRLAANHWELALESHAANFPTTCHWQGDIAEADLRREMPYGEFFWASPECPKWSNARGVKRNFTVEALQQSLFDDEDEEPLPTEAEERSRALMWDVTKYLTVMPIKYGKPVLAGVVENVVDVRAWSEWNDWIADFRKLGYKVRLIALNSMHALGHYTGQAPQSRDRLYLAYWHKSLGRDPEWERWLRPKAYCLVCDEWVAARQVFKRPGADMGSYRSQYVYRCPNLRCRGMVVEPPVVPAATVIDWSDLGKRIGDRKKPLSPKTMKRIVDGLATYYGTPLTVPCEGRDGKRAQPAVAPLRTQTARAETGLAAHPSFIAELRGGGSKHRPVSDPLATVTASGNHHGLVSLPLPAGLMVPTGGSWNDEALPVSAPMRTRTTREFEALLVPYYGKTRAQKVSSPMGTLTTVDRFGLLSSQGVPEVEDCCFRMLQPEEIGLGMAFGRDYIVLGTKRAKVRQYGNAVTPNAAEVLASALVETITGEQRASAWEEWTPAT